MQIESPKLRLPKSHYTFTERNSIPMDPWHMQSTHIHTIKHLKVCPIQMDVVLIRDSNFKTFCVLKLTVITT